MLIWKLGLGARPRSDMLSDENPCIQRLPGFPVPIYLVHGALVHASKGDAGTQLLLPLPPQITMQPGKRRMAPLQVNSLQKDRVRAEKASIKGHGRRPGAILHLAPASAGYCIPTP